MKMLILGHGRHGKDTVADLIKDHLGLKADSSSHFAMNLFLRRQLEEEHGLVYSTGDECYEDRVNHRDLWYRLIQEYNRNDPTRLAKKLLAENDIYVGMRCDLEYKQCVKEGLFDRILWVDRSRCRIKEPSMNIEYNPATMILLDNNGRLDNLERLTYTWAWKYSNKVD